MSSLSHRVVTQAPTVYTNYDFFSSKLINMEKYILFVFDMVFSKFINL